MVWACIGKRRRIRRQEGDGGARVKKERTHQESRLKQCLIQDKISTSPSPTDRRAVVTPRGRRAARSSHWAIFLLNNIAITNNSTFPKIKLHYSISYCNKTKSNNLI